MSDSTHPELLRLISVVSRLRQECPWDKAQTHLSLTRYLIEEAFEAVEAIESSDMPHLCEELGDVLLQVLLHAEIANETQQFSLEDLAKRTADKMIRRHPHVFAKGSACTPDEVRTSWEQIKAAEKAAKGETVVEGLLEGVPVAMPALALSQRYGEKMSALGFDWKDTQGVVNKLREEVQELETALQSKDPLAIEEEMGDVFFTLTNLARHTGLDSERAAKKSAKKFKTRISRMEQEVKKQGKNFSALNTEQMEALWEKAKTKS